MSECYVGEIRMFASSSSTRIPSGWVICDGRLLSINTYQALYSLIGTIYGGDGQTTFAVPDLRGRIPIHKGQAVGSTNNYLIGQKVGVESVTLTTNQLPAHTHALAATTAVGASAVPNTSEVLSMPATTSQYAYTATATHATTLNPNTVSSTGNSQAHDNMMPTCAISFIIATDGFYPTKD